MFSILNGHWGKGHRQFGCSKTLPEFLLEIQNTLRKVVSALEGHMNNILGIKRHI